MFKKCLDCVKNIKLDKVAVFAGGVLFGTAGLKVLGSKDAKKVYTQGTAAVLRAKDCVMKQQMLCRKMQRIFCLKQSRSTRNATKRRTP